jgi:hypothetical protein
MWKHHVVYESKPHSVIVTLLGHLYIVLEEFIPYIVLEVFFDYYYPFDLHKEMHKVIT